MFVEVNGGSSYISSIRRGRGLKTEILITEIRQTVISLGVE